MNSKLITRPGQRRVDFTDTPQSEDAPPGPYAIATYALVCVACIVAFVAFVAGYAIALHGLSN